MPAYHTPQLLHLGFVAQEPVRAPERPTTPTRRSIRTHLLGLVLATLLPTLGVIVYDIVDTGQVEVARANGQAAELAARVAEDIDQFFGNTDRLLSRVAERPLIRSADARRCDPILHEAAVLAEFANLGVRDVSGTLVCSFLPGLSAVPAAKAPWFEQALHAPGLSVSGALAAPQDAGWVSLLSRPLRDSGGRPTGALTARVDLNTLQANMLHSLPPNALVTVLDREGRFIMRSSDKARWVGQTLAPAWLQRLQESDKGILREPGVDGVVRLTAFRRVPASGWTVVVGLPEDDVLAPYRQHLAQGIVIALAAVALALFLARGASRTIAGSMRTLARTAMSISRGNLGTRAALDGPAEVVLVAKELNRMLDANDRARQRARESERRVRETLDNVDLIAVVVDEAGLLRYGNDHFLQLTGRRAEEVLGKCWFDTFVASEPALRRSAFLSAMASGEIDRRLKYEIFARGGERRLVHWNNTVLRSDDGRITGLSSIGEDVTDRMAAERHIKYLATHDGLTGLPNRTLVRDRIAQAIGHARRTGKSVAVMCVDLDRFKHINDGWGHPFGDALLVQLSRRLAGLVRESDTVARQGGDEFLVLLGDLDKAADAYIVAQKMVDSFEQTLPVQDRELALTASIGVAVYPQNGEDPDTLISNADVAMYRAKNQGGNAYQFFGAEMSDGIRQRVDFENRLRQALPEQRLQLVYQPKVDLASGAIVGAEALLRWNDPQLGAVSPARFIPLAEESGLIVPIGDWVLRTACAQNRAWRDAGLAPIVMSVNVSLRQFQQQDVVAWVHGALADTGLPPEGLELELTESLIAQDAEKVVATVDRLQAAGVQLSIDDFGTGYSSLSYLKRFHANTLKIDQSFVRNLLQDPDDAAIALAVITLAHSLRMKAIAEGVETAEHCAFLREHGCDQIQGYYFSRPVPAEEFAQMLRSDRRLPALDNESAPFSSGSRRSGTLQGQV